MLQDLQYLSLTGTGLRATPWFVPSMRSLLTLNLSTNSLTALSPGIAVLTSLTYLSVAHNHLSCVPAFVGTLGELRELHVAHNHIIAVARPVFQVTNLCSLAYSYLFSMNLPDLFLMNSGWNAHWCSSQNSKSSTFL